MKQQVCDRCLTVLQTVDGAPLADFCSGCLRDEQLQSPTDNLHKFRRRHFNKMQRQGANKFVARFQTLMLSQAPYWQERE